MVNLKVKTITGKKFNVDVEPSQTIAEVKGVIETTNAEFPAAQLKLIHSGKILKDEISLQEYNIKEDEFIVCMVAKPKAASSPAGASGAATSTPAAAAAPAPAVTSLPSASITPATSTTGASSTTNEDHVRRLMDMGFPDDQARAALRAAMGNPDVAVEFLMNGVPDNFEGQTTATTPAVPTPAPATAPAPSPGGMETLDDFRRHPQFNDLKRLVQRDPAMLSDVLQTIAQQSPTLIARIHENQQEFIALMHEPVEESAAPAVPSGDSTGAPGGAGAMGTLGSMMGMMGPGGGAGNPAQMAQLLQGLTPVERAQMATEMGVSPQQLAQVSQLIANLPQDQFQRLMGMVSAGGMPGAGIGSGRGMPPGAGASAGANVIRLTEEESAAVARLSELGFDRTDAAQTYLACDKNEALAANLLMDGMGSMGAGVPAAFQPPATSSTTALSADASPSPDVATASSSSSTEQGSTTQQGSSSETATSADDSRSTNATADVDNPSTQEGGTPDEDEDMYG